MAESVSIKAHCADVFSYARFQNGMRAVNRIVIRNTSGGILTGLRLTVESDPEIIHSSSLHIGDIKDGASVVIDDVRADISTNYLANLTECQSGVLRIKVSSEEEGLTPVSFTHKITILPYDQWEGVRRADEHLACFCVPNHPEVKNIIKAASRRMLEWTGNPSMDGYAGGDPGRVKMMMAAIFGAIKDLNIAYALPPASFYESGQRIRMPEEIVGTRLATCLDTTMLYVSCLEAASLRPLVILNRTHAYAGAWLDEDAISPSAVSDDPSLLRKRDAEGINQLIPVETTKMDKGISMGFDDAVLAAEETLADADSFECVIDIHEARKLGVNPLPQRVWTADGYEIIPDGTPDVEQRPEALPASDKVDLTAEPFVEKQIIWERKLLDLTLRNNLLNIHPRSILQLMNPNTQMIVSALENGRSMRIGPCPDFWEGQMTGNGIYAAISAADKMQTFTDEEVYDGRLRTFVDEKTSLTRMMTLRETAKRSLEENGANTLYLTAGALKWTDTERQKEHYAPILLVPCEIMRLSGALVATGEETVINLTLLEMLRENFELTIPGLDPLPQKDGHTDVRLVLNTVRKAVMDKKGWDVEPLVFLGNFTFSKFIIWNDIHSWHKIFDSNPMISSLKNGALDKRIKPLRNIGRDIDSLCPPDEVLLPIDADSSQMKAIRDALDGRSFIMQGPPGTGKSQTITNIIANALYHGKRVLFVSEKKAALEVVQKRLESIGLGPLCLELHSNKAKKSMVLSKLEKTLEQKAPAECGTFGSEAARVAELRSVLVRHVEALHCSGDEGMTLYGALSQYLAAPQNLPFRNMPNIVMSSLSPDSIRQMQAVVRDFAAAAGRVSLDDIRDLLDLPLSEYTPALMERLKAEMEALLATNGRLLFRLRSRRLAKILGVDFWNGLGLNRSDSRRDKVGQWYGALDRLRDYAIYNSRRTALRSRGLGVIASDFEACKVAPDALSDSLMKSLQYSYIRKRVSSDAHLGMFCGDMFNNTVRDYRETERAFRDSCRKEICRRMYSGIEALAQETFNPQLTILKKAIRGGARGMSLRTLFSKIPDLLPRLCPCMLMSPLSVAQYLQANPDMFDLVIFDEASQMQTSEAVGSIGRGHSLIVAGDSKQLPPTAFFETLSFDEDNADREDLESILEDCISLSLPANTLRWHYRSRHESLISFSNSKYYGNSLLTFPSTDDLTSKVTLKRIDGLYERGGTRQNKAEAEAVVAEIKRRLENAPDRSIGVITFSQPQQAAVEKRLETMLRNNPGLEEIASRMDEPIFVKNLENVQGDERDVILFSVGYGPDKSGRIPMNFGPLNQSGGWRRLNVAVSRARCEMKVFSSLSPDDIRVDYNTPKGVVGLRDFLRYASDGRRTLEEYSAEAAEHDAWVEKVAAELRERGLRVNTNIGTSDFRIDIAVLDEEKGRYIYGIICDGPNYASAPSAVDREVVRPAILENLGWHIERRWIMDEWR